MTYSLSVLYLWVLVRLLNGSWALVIQSWVSALPRTAMTKVLSAIFLYTPIVGIDSNNS